MNGSLVFQSNIDLLYKFYNNKNVLLKYFELAKKLNKKEWLKFINFLLSVNDIQKEVFGETFFVEPGFDQNSLPGIKDWFEEHYTISFSNYPVDTHYVDQPHVVPCDS